MKSVRRAFQLLIFLMLLLIGVAVQAKIILESAPLGPAGGFNQLNSSVQARFGSRFSISETTEITVLGAFATVFAGGAYLAIVPLPTPTGLPSGNVEDIALFHTTFELAGNGDAIDYREPVAVVLPAGDYAVVIGTGAFGVDGTVWLYGEGPFNPGTTYLRGSGSGSWSNGAGATGGGERFVVEGYAAVDADEDGVATSADNCLDVVNSDQRDTDGDGIGNACDPDLNNDNSVDFGDLPALQAAFFSQAGDPPGIPPDPNWNPDADLNGDGSVDFGDLPKFQSLFFQPPGPSGKQTVFDYVTIPSQLLSVDIDDYIDLDLPVTDPAGDSDPTMDLRIFSFPFAIQSVNGGEIAWSADDEPTFDNCATGFFGPLILHERLPIGAWLCARTGDGRLAKLQLVGTDTADPAFATQFDFELTTLECDQTGFGPNSCDIRDLKAWLDATDSESLDLTADGSRVTAWRDRAGNTAPMAVANTAQRPGVSAGPASNGLTVVEFDGVDDHVCTSTVIDPRLFGITVLFVAKNDVRKNYNGILSLRNSINANANFEVYWQQGAAGSGNLIAATNRNTGPLRFFSAQDAGPVTPLLYQATVSIGQNGAGGLRVDGVPVGSSGNTVLLPDQAAPLCVGLGFGPALTGNILDGSIGELLVFDRELDADEVLFVEDYLRTKWLVPE